MRKVKSRPGRGGFDLGLVARDLVSSYKKRDSGSSMTAVTSCLHLTQEVQLWA